MPAISATLSQGPSQVQRQLPAAHLTKTMQLLEKTCTDLETEVTRELADNPALELVDELRCPSCKSVIPSFPCQICISRLRLDGDGPIVYVSPRPTSPYRTGDDDVPFQDRIRQPVSLSEHVLRQVAPELKPDEHRVAAYILAQLDEHGFYQEHPAETSVYLRARLASVQRVLELIQQADPVGVATTGIHECLLTQIDSLSADGVCHPLAKTLLVDFLDHLGRRDYKAIAQKCRLPEDNIREAAEFIHDNLAPYPAQSWSNQGQTNGRYQHPDVQISRNVSDPDGPLMVEVFMAFRGWLRVDPQVRSLVKQVEDKDRKADWVQCVERAALFVKCMRQRNNGMRRVVHEVVKRQPDFILGGDADLIPMTRAELAKALDLHESTISRAVSQKTVGLPNGRIIPMARFFDRSLAVRETVRTIIQSETSPLTDDQVAVALEGHGYKVARRTVAKYRSMLHILPANLRGKQLPRQANGKQSNTLSIQSS